MKNWIADGTFTGQNADDLLAAIDEQNKAAGLLPDEFYEDGGLDWDDLSEEEIEEIRARNAAEFESCTDTTDCDCSYCTAAD